VDEIRMSEACWLALWLLRARDTIMFLLIT